MVGVKRWGSYLLKAYAAGCVGCLGVWTAIIVLIAVLGVLFGASALDAVESAQKELGSALQGMQSAIGDVGSAIGNSPFGGNFGPFGPEGPRDGSLGSAGPSAGWGSDNPSGPSDASGGVGRPSQATLDCLNAAKIYLARGSATDTPTNSFTRADAIMPVTDSSGDCGEATVRVLAMGLIPVVEKPLAVRKGRIVHDDLNPERSATPGSYRVEFRAGSNVVQSIPISVR